MLGDILFDIGCVVAIAGAVFWWRKLVSARAAGARCGADRAMSFTLVLMGAVIVTVAVAWLLVMYR